MGDKKYQLDDLPEEILEKIFSSINDVDTLNNAIRISRRMFNILSEPKFRYLITQKLIRENQPHGKIIIQVDDEQQEEILQSLEETIDYEMDILDTEMNCTITYFLGKIHSINDEPAVVRSDGTRKWYKNGLLHRDDDKPAIIYGSGTNEWYKNGLLHRDDDKPALELRDGTKYWYNNGVIHRDPLLGPAVIYPSKDFQYWVNGKRINFD